MRCLMIDIGGTNTKFGLSIDKKTICEKSKIPTNASEGFFAVFERLIHEVKKYLPLDLIAISQAGVVSEDSSILFANPKLKDFSGNSFKKEFEKELKIKTFVVNDAKAGASFVAKNISDKNALLLVLGTGVGAAMIINGSVFMAPLGITGEIGIAISEDKPIDDHLSLSLLKARLVKENKNADFDQYCALISSSGELKDYINKLAIWTYNAFVIYGLENIYFGGSLPAFGPKILTDTSEEIKKINPVLGALIKLSFAPSGEDANLLGALFVALERSEK